MLFSVPWNWKIGTNGSLSQWDSILLYLFYRLRNWGLESLSSLPTVDCPYSQHLMCPGSGWPFGEGIFFHSHQPPILGTRRHNKTSSLGDKAVRLRIQQEQSLRLNITHLGLHQIIIKMHTKPWTWHSGANRLWSMLPGTPREKPTISKKYINHGATLA